MDNNKLIIGILFIALIVALGTAAYLMGQQSVTDFQKEADEAIERMEQETNMNTNVSDAMDEDPADDQFNVCYSDADCDEDAAYCQFSNGCGGAGTCKAIPQVCTLQYDPVCGCDQKTYGNACGAAAASQTVDYKGECTAAKTCSDNSDCSIDGYCKKDSCGAATGVCTEKPANCPEVIVPACGCDGKEYLGECGAANVGVNINFLGACQ